MKENLGYTGIVFTFSDEALSQNVTHDTEVIYMKPNALHPRSWGL